MAGNWIDNTATIGKIDGKYAVFTGSHDYHVYAFDALTGKEIWKKPLGGEIYSAPAFFQIDNTPHLAVSALDNHLYLLKAQTGEIVTAFYTGNPIWDKVAKGENLWGSPAAISAGNSTLIIHGSFNDTVFFIPAVKETELRAMAKSPESLWISLLVVGVIFLFGVLPFVVRK